LTAKEVLGRVLDAGGAIIPDPARPRLRVPPDLKALVLEHRRALRELVLAQARPAHLPWAHPWPDALPALGRRSVGAFDLCDGCGRGSWARYGRMVLCLACALTREKAS